MFSFFSRQYENCFEYGRKIGDPFWFIERCITLSTKKGLYFGVLYFTLVFTCVEVCCETYMLLYKPRMETILRLAPIYANLVLCFFCIAPILKQRYQYKIIIQTIRNDFYPLVNIDRNCYRAIREMYKNVVMIFLFLCGSVFVALTLLQPWFGVVYEETIWPAVEFLSLIKDPPRWLTVIACCVNYASLYPKAYSMAFYTVHVVHLIQLYKIQHILLKNRLEKIKYYGKMNDLYHNDVIRYQRWVRWELVECIKFYIRLRKFGKLVEEYFKVTVFIQSFVGIFLLTMLSYIAVQGQGGSNAVPLRMELVIINVGLYIFVYYGEVFAAQVGDIRTTFYELPWYTFDIKTRKIMLIFSHLLNETQYIGLLIFDLNYSIAFWMIHKVFNFLTILGNLSDEL